ncbi:hypothetical protein BJ508DRAFT_67965 [Ascobolus immersus RN42]|uniref:Uncharacterized protein n=1 Tax=Ascobolus immersus RN42 TaxID=1160509 RepID=A0A3N4HSU3_ASCIM|nr:hypothetical protein BJ508DRAFT_67965 [Ascobolus immersus RN42]
MSRPTSCRILRRKQLELYSSAIYPQPPSSSTRTCKILRLPNGKVVPKLSSDRISQIHQPLRLPPLVRSLDNLALSPASLRPLRILLSTSLSSPSSPSSNQRYGSQSRKKPCGKVCNGCTPRSRHPLRRFDLQGNFGDWLAVDGRFIWGRTGCRQASPGLKEALQQHPLHCMEVD